MNVRRGANQAGKYFAMAVKLILQYSNLDGMYVMTWNSVYLEPCRVLGQHTAMF